MANRYRVGGSSTRNKTAGTKRALTSGGAGGQAEPTSADDVFFDANSGTVVVTLDTSYLKRCRNLNCTGFTGTLTAGSGNGLLIYASLTLDAGMTYSVDCNIYMEGLYNYTITTAGKTLNDLSISSGVVGTCTLIDELIVGGSLNINVTTFNTGNNNITCESWFTSINNGHNSTLNLGSSIITINGAGDGWWIREEYPDEVILNAGTSTIKITGTGDTYFNGGDKTYNNVEINSTTCNIYGNNTYNDLKIGKDGAQTIIFDDLTYQLMTSFTCVGAAGKVKTLGGSGTKGRRLIDNAGTNNCDYIDVSYCMVEGGATWNMGANSTDSGNNEGRAGATIENRYWVLGSGTRDNTDTTHWSLTFGGVGGASVPTSAMNVFLDQGEGVVGGTEEIAPSTSSTGGGSPGWENGIRFTASITTKILQIRLFPYSGAFARPNICVLKTVAGVTIATTTDIVDDIVTFGVDAVIEAGTDYRLLFTNDTDAYFIGVYTATLPDIYTPFTVTHGYSQAGGGDTTNYLYLIKDIIWGIETNPAITIGTGAACRHLNSRLFTGTFDTGYLEINGDVVTENNLGNLEFKGATNNYLQTYKSYIETPQSVVGDIIIDKASGKITLTTSLSCGDIQLTNGELDFDTYSVVSSGGFSTTTGTSILSMGTGIINFESRDVDDGTLTLNCETSKLIINGNGTFAGNGKTYYNVNFNSATHTITGSNTFNVLEIGSSLAQTITFTDGTTQIIETFNCIGRYLNTKILQGSGTAGRYLVNTNEIVTCDYIDVSYSRVGGDLLRYMGIHSIDSGNNTGRQTQTIVNKKNYVIKIYDKDMAYKSDIDYTKLMSDVSFTNNINGGQGELMLLLNDGFNSSTYSLGDFIKIFVYDNYNIGALIYCGYISKINRVQNINSQSIELVILGLTALLTKYLVDGTVTGEPATIVKKFVDDFNTDFGTNIFSYDAGSIDTYGSNIDISLGTVDAFSAIKEVKDITGYYFYIGADGKFYFKVIPTAVNHYITNQKDVEGITVQDNMEDVINYLIVNRYGDVEKIYQSVSSQTTYGLKQMYIDKSGIIVNEDTQDNYGGSYLDANKLLKRQTNIIVNSLYNIESITPGQVIKIINFDYTDASIPMIIIQTRYTRNNVELIVNKRSSFSELVVG